MRAHDKLNTIRKKFYILGIIFLSLSLFPGCKKNIGVFPGEEISSVTRSQKSGWNNAYFRGTPNDWGITPMVKEGELWVIRHAFVGDNSRFKITPSPDWREAYPASDYLITRGPGNYKIIFNDITKDISVYKQ